MGLCARCFARGWFTQLVANALVCKKKSNKAVIMFPSTKPAQLLRKAERWYFKPKETVSEVNTKVKWLFFFWIIIGNYKYRNTLGFLVMDKAALFFYFFCIATLYFLFQGWEQEKLNANLVKASESNGAGKKGRNKTIQHTFIWSWTEMQCF